MSEHPLARMDSARRLAARCVERPYNKGTVERAAKVITAYVSDLEARLEKAEAERDKWQPIETAPELERVLVAGWQPQNGNVAGYWWWHEDSICDGGAAEHWQATHWCRVNIPKFPEPPALKDKS